jgi:hypothetical protein
MKSILHILKFLNEFGTVSLLVSQIRFEILLDSEVALAIMGSVVNVVV